MTDKPDLKAPPPAHYYAGRFVDPDSRYARPSPLGRCAREFGGQRCGRPPEDPVHLRPGDVRDAPSLLRKAATG